MKFKTCWWTIAIILAGCGNREAEAPVTETVANVDEAAIAAATALIGADNILNGVKVLADDQLKGRGTGTEGERQAAEWIADQFKTMGLKPLGDNFFQKVELVGYQKNPETSSLTLKGEAGPIAYQNEETLTYWSTSQKEKVALTDAPLLFVGYGVEAPEFGWDDFKGVDCTGKILVFLNNDPQTGDPTMFGGEARTYYGRYTYKFEQAVAKGAAGAIMIHTTPSAGYGWSVIGSSGSRRGFALNLPDTGYQLDFLAWIHQDLANQLAATVDTSLEEWFARANRKDFQPEPLPVSLDCEMEVSLSQTASQNVVGVWEGSDPQLKDQLIVYSAHYDHLGEKEDGDGDRIYNGAWDNASGTVAIIEIARAFSQSGLRPRRSIAFLACAAEEKGLLGSQWFTANPPVPLPNIVANLNIDMPQIFGLSSDMVALGYDGNRLGDVLVEIASQTAVEGAAGTTITIKGDQNPNAGSFYRSDQVNFAKAGIPALFLLPGVSYVNPPKVDPRAFHAEHYHQVSDEVNEFWDLAGCVRDMKVAMTLAIRIAMADEIPTWHPGNEFENAWKRLHGK